MINRDSTAPGIATVDTVLGKSEGVVATEELVSDGVVATDA